MNTLDYDVSGMFKRACKADPEKSEAIVAIDVLTRILKSSDVSTVRGLHDVLNAAIQEMCDTGRIYLCVKSACELFQRFITLTIAEAPDDFERCKQVLQTRADLFLSKVGACKSHIAVHLSRLIPDGSHILIHSYSRVVLSALTSLATKNPKLRLHCHVTTCLPHESGRKMMKALAKLRIPCTLIPDLSLAYLMPLIDVVLMGAQAVVESGGILNDLGSSTVAMIASAFGKPVYVVAESFKFIRAFPLDQQRIPVEFRGSSGFSPPNSPLRNLTISDRDEDHERGESPPVEGDDFPEMRSTWSLVQRQRVRTIEHAMPSIDYTQPCYISFLITDLGVLTPSVVSDELIKLYL